MRGVHTLVWLLPVAAALWLTWPTLAPVLELWLDDGTYSHGSLLLLTCAWLAWHEHKHLRWPPAAVAPIALLPLLAALALYALALATDVDLLQRALLLPVWLLTFTVVAGTARARRLVFPAILLSLALPLWGLLVAPLQQAAVAVVGTLLDAQQIPARIHATYIRIPAGDFEVAQGCSGLRYLLVSAAVTLLWSRLYLRGLGAMLAYLGIGLLAALVTNWIRIYLLILIGHETEMRHPLMEDHNNFGWYIFAVMLVPLFWIGRKLPHRDDDDSDEAAPAAVSAERLPRLLTASAMVLVLLVASVAVTRHTPDATGANLVLHPPLPAPPTRLVPVPANSWAPDYVGLDRQWQLAYQAPQRDFTLFLGWYAMQRNGAELDGPANRLAGARWRVDHSALPCPAQARCTVLSRDNRKRLVIYWHQVNGTWVTSRLTSKWQQLLGRLSGRTDAAIVALSSDCREDCRAVAQQLWQQAAPLFDDLAAQLQNHGAQRNE